MNAGREPGGSVRERLCALPAARREHELTAYLCARAAHFLGLPEHAVAPDASWIDLGFDSLRAVDFRSELAATLQLELRSTLLFDHANARALAVHLGQQLAPVAAATCHTAIAPAAHTGGEAIAIVGAACRFPGGESLDEFWQLLAQGRDAVAPIPAERFDVDAHYNPDPAAEGKLYVREAGLLRDIAGFDAALFGIAPREAVMLDPQQRLLLETSWHALEHANVSPRALAGQRVGVYVGTRASEYFDSQTNRTANDVTSYYATGTAVSTAAGRLSYTFGFQGPCYALDTACSGSLVAVHIAVRALRARECDAALAGGVNAVFDPVPMIGLCRARMLSPDGRCKSFDRAANGYGRGEGCGIVVLKRLADARAHGDRILGVVLGTSINQDGRSGGLTVPHGPSQSAVIRAALADAGLGIDAIHYVEAHGTGTALGDPIEIGALDAVFAGRTQPLPIGSVKTNIGHLEAAAGISGLLKTVLALRARTLPATLHFREPTPHVDWARSVVQVVAAPRPLPAGDTPLYAGVSSFGFSGTNAHVIVGSAPPADAVAARAQRGPWLLPLQAASGEALRELAAAHAQALAAGGVDLADWCHAASSRAPLPQRAAFVAATPAELAASLRAFAGGDDRAATAAGLATPAPKTIAFLFPGQGAQRAGMGKELYEEEPVFRDALDAAATLLQGQLPAPLLELMWGNATALLDRTDATQPVLCAYELALLALFRSVRVVPDHVLGHSVGDFAAAVAAGVMDGSDALRLCAARGRLMVERCPPGGMLAIAAPAARWQHLLADLPRASIAVHNAEANVVVGGDAEQLATLQQRVAAIGITARALPVSHAFHTANTEPMLAPFEDLVAAVRLRPPACSFVDCRSGELGGAGLATAAHWRAHVREPVQFQRGLQTLAARGCAAWIELGPVPMLAALARSNGASDVRVLAAQRAQLPGRSGLLAVLAEAWVLGVDVDLAAGNHGRGAPRATLPSYPFQRRRFWLERNTAGGLAASAGLHPLLGERRESSLLLPGQTLFAGELSAARPAWLADHKALGHVLLPAAGMIEMALAAEALAGTPLPIAVTGMSLRAPRPLTERTTQVELVRTAANGGASFVLKGRDDDGTWRTHCEGSSGPGDGTAALDVAAVRARCRDAMTPEQLYERCGRLQLEYGPAFRCVQQVWCGDAEVLASVELGALSATAFVLHPALLDACFHAVVAALPGETTPFLPLGVEAVVVHRRSAKAALCHVTVRAGTSASRVADLLLAGDDGAAIATVRGLQLVPADPALVASSAARELLYHETWEVAPAPAPAPPPARTAIVGWPALAAALRDRLPDGGAQACSPLELPAVLAAQRIDELLFLADGFLADGAATGSEPMPVQERLLGELLATLRCALRAPTPPRLWLVTHGVQGAAPAPAGPVPHAASLLGVFRTLALEHPGGRALAIDLDPLLPASALAEHAAAVVAELRSPADENEVALRSGQRRVRRLRRGPAPNDRLAFPRTPFRVRTSAYGSFDHLGVVPLARRTPGPGEVELAMTATALNFKDVLHARGMLREFAERAGIHAAADQPLGFEGCGVVTAVGAGVTSVRAGDAAVAIAADSLASHVTVAASAVFPLPEGVDAIAAAGTPIVFETVLHALLDLARVQRGETVLVHAAAGGVGQAAIQVARRAGARVLATASAGKRAFVQALGVDVVGDSRAADFLPGVMAATGGRGVDVVLNTTSGDGVGKSLQALAVNGRFVELGKLGVWTAEQVRAARPDVRFFAFDLGDEFQRDATLMPRLLEQLRAGLAGGELRPPLPTVLPLSHARAAFHHLGKGHHVGKVIVCLPRAAPDALRSDRCYLLTGGSGGIAPAIADALVNAGARHLALLARGDVPAALLADLRARGCTVLALRADAGDRASLADALARLRTELPPLGGIVHAAGALADAALATLDWPRAAAALRPKVAGAIWLDELTAADPLDFFVATSSIAGTLGNPGQAAYAAANTFLDAFAAHRRARGRPAAALAFGPLDGGGMASRLDERLRARLHQHGVSFVPAATASRLLVQHRDDPDAIAAMAVRWPEWLAPLGARAPRAFRDLGAARPQAAAHPPAIDVRALPPAERKVALRTAVRAQIAAVLGFAESAQLDADRTFRDLGLDSLLAVDAKDRLARLIGAPLPATLLFDHPDLDRLVAHLLAILLPAAAPPALPAALPVLPVADELDELDTDTLARTLEAELRDLRAQS